MKFSTGYLELFFGPMCSNKTTLLGTSLSIKADIGAKTIYFNSKKDTREQKFFISTNCSTDNPDSKISNKVKMVKVLNLKEAYELAKDYDVVGVDEAQFFPDLLEIVPKWIDDKKQVYISGLSASFLMSKFEPPLSNITDLIPICNKSKHLRAKCRVCFIQEDTMERVPDAPFTFKIVDDDRQEQAGGTTVYAAVCRKHYIELKNLTESERREILNK